LKKKKTGVRSGGVYQMWSKGNANGISYGRCLNFVAFQFTLSFFLIFFFVTLIESDDGTT